MLETMFWKLKEIHWEKLGATEQSVSENMINMERVGFFFFFFFTIIVIHFPKLEKTQIIEWMAIFTDKSETTTT